ncbi:hypothetical protein GCM10028857_08990 [Salinarchaeum chitinilyticum]
MTDGEDGRSVSVADTERVPADTEDGPRRRSLLGVAGAAGVAALAGCWGMAYEYLDFQALDPAALADRAAVTDHDRGPLIDALESYGSVSGTEPDSAFVDGDFVATDDDSYHELSVAQASERWIGRAFGFEPVAGSVGGSTIAATELPATDRAVLEEAFESSGDGSPGEESSGDGSVDSDPFGDGVTIAGVGSRVSRTDQGSSSMLGDADGEFLTRAGERYRIHVRDRTVATRRKEYSIENSWGSAEALGEWLGRERATALRNLTDSERDVVQAAIDGKSKRADADRDAFDAIVHTLLDDEPIKTEDGDGLTMWVVRWNGTAYWAIYRGT